MQTLLIDNHDSFTYNLFQLLAEVNGREPVVVRNDEASWDGLERLGFDNVVISPGPGRPEVTGDFGVCAEAIRRCEKPLLGVCLGHQGIGWMEGGEVRRAPEPMHGRVAEIEHDGSQLFEGIPSPFRTTRYHSLALARPLPPTLREIAGCDGVPMALEHRTRPQWGVQFHPESIATDHGKRLLENFRDLTSPAPTARSVPFVRHSRTKATEVPRLGLAARRLDVLPDPETAFVSLYGDSEYAFWLDSSRPGPRARFSFMGDATGPLGEVITYGRNCNNFDNSIFDFLKFRAAQLRPTEVPDLPFEFDCGFVGYLGYELKAECGYGEGAPSEQPDAVFILADRVIAFDHEEQATYLLSLHELGEEGEEVGVASKHWLDATEMRLLDLARAWDGESGEPSRTLPAVVRE
ncbi:MAG TPA: gamma-glutamyl-gamma-aminobutyrate hydrolase family protein, partial [Solirubrobacterales bacterium]